MKSTPLQSGPIPGYVRGIIKEFEARGESFQPGDVIIHNDPYNGASHAPDIGFCVPIFHGDRLIPVSAGWSSVPTRMPKASASAR